MTINRRQLLSRASQATTAWIAAPVVGASLAHPSLVLAAPPEAAASTDSSDSLPMQLYKSLSDEQRSKICLPNDHKRRQHISNWWYVHQEHRINNTFNDEQRALIQQIFDSLHHPEHRTAINKQVELDQYGQEKNSPSVGFFGTPEDKDFEFIYTGHHVTRRTNAHSDKGQGLAGGPLFYGHFYKEFNETKEHPHNPYWYQGKLFNEFVQELSGEQQKQGLAQEAPRSERSNAVIQIDKTPPGLACQPLSDDLKQLLRETMGKMLGMFRESDVQATLRLFADKSIVDELHVSWYGGKFDIGSDKVWDTWTIEGPRFVWYFRGQPHIHSYFHLKVA